MSPPYRDEVEINEAHIRNPNFKGKNYDSNYQQNRNKQYSTTNTLTTRAVMVNKTITTKPAPTETLITMKAITTRRTPSRTNQLM